MEGLDLYIKVADLLLEVSDSYSKVAGYLRRYFKVYPTSEYDLDSENKKLEGTGLALSRYYHNICLYPTRYIEMLRSLNFVDDLDLKNPYKLFPKYDSLFQKSLKGYPTDIDAYERFLSNNGIYYTMDPIVFLESVYEDLLVANKVFKEDYISYKTHDYLFKKYEDIFDTNPTGDYKELELLFKKHKLTGNRVWVVDGVIKACKSFNFNTVTVALYQGNFSFYPTESINIEPYNEDTAVSLSNLTSDINKLLELKADMEIATEIVDLIKAIKNINYFEK